MKDCGAKSPFSCQGMVALPQGVCLLLIRRVDSEESNDIGRCSKAGRAFNISTAIPSQMPALDYQAFTTLIHNKPQIRHLSDLSSLEPSSSIQASKDANKARNRPRIAHLEQH